MDALHGMDRYKKGSKCRLSYRQTDRHLDKSLTKYTWGCFFLDEICYLTTPFFRRGINNDAFLQIFDTVHRKVFFLDEICYLTTHLTRRGKTTKCFYLVKATYNRRRFLTWCNLLPRLTRRGIQLREGMIIEWPLFHLFHDVVINVLTSRNNVRRWMITFKR